MFFLHSPSIHLLNAFLKQVDIVRRRGDFNDMLHVRRPLILFFNIILRCPSQIGSTDTIWNWSKRSFLFSLRYGGWVFIRDS